MRVETQVDLVGELFCVVGRFRRQMRRSTGRGFDTSGLTEAQTELLRLVGRRPGISVREAAEELGLAANTASTLVSRLAGDGLLNRDVDAEDRRVGRLRLTASAQRIADESLEASRAALAGVLAELDSEQRDALSRGLAVMTEMTDKLRMRGDR